jgi:hypothetical protein
MESVMALKNIKKHDGNVLNGHKVIPTIAMMLIKRKFGSDVGFIEAFKDHFNDKRTLSPGVVTAVKGGRPAPSKIEDIIEFLTSHKETKSIFNEDSDVLTADLCITNLDEEIQHSPLKTRAVLAKTIGVDPETIDWAVGKKPISASLFALIESSLNT